MLKFFRKYQRLFFVLVAIVTIASFSFFGTYHSINPATSTEDHPVGNAVDGSTMMHREIQLLSRFLSSDQLDPRSNRSNKAVNYLNDGVICKDFFEPRLGILLIEEFFETLKPELQLLYQKHQQFQPYQHPTAPFISATQVWQQVSPEYKKRFDLFQKSEKGINLNIVKLLIELYLYQTSFPPSLLKEYLSLQQKYYHRWVQPDPYLSSANLSLFHCDCLEEWFGKSFIELCAQVIHNTALFAQQKGYIVSEEEAKASLLDNGMEVLRGQQKRSHVTSEERLKFFKEQLRTLNMKEWELVAVWKKIMLFRRLFQSYGSGVVLDSLPYRTFHHFASRSANVEVYRLPDSLQLNTFQDLLKLQVYLESVGKEVALPLLPHSFQPVDVVERTHPELVEHRFLVEISEVSIDEVALNVHLHDMWAWQEENFEILKSRWPELTKGRRESVEKCEAILNQLDDVFRQQVDQFSRKMIAQQHPEWIHDLLNQKSLIKRELGFSSRGENPLVHQEKAGRKLEQLLSKAAFKNQLEEDEEACHARKELELFSEDQITYYRIQLLDRDLKKRILTFTEANAKGVLDKILDAKLKTSHPTLFSPQEKGKNLQEKKESGSEKAKVGAMTYAHLLDAIDQSCLDLGITLPEDRREHLDVFYPKYYFLPYMQLVEKEIIVQGDQSAFLTSPPKEQGPLDRTQLKPPSSLETQWSLVKEHKKFIHHEKHPYLTPDLFSMSEGSWSPIAHNHQRALIFFYLHTKELPQKWFSQEIQMGQQLLADEAKQYLMDDLLTLFQQRQCIHLSLPLEQD